MEFKNLNWQELTGISRHEKFLARALSSLPRHGSKIELETKTSVDKLNIRVWSGY